MKTLLLVWNILLTGGLIYVLMRGNGATAERNGSAVQDTLAVAGLPIAFVNIDSLEKHYQLFADKKEQLEKKQKSMEALLEKKFTEIQNDYQAAQQAAASMTPAQLEEAQRRLENKQLELQRLQQQMETDFQKQIEAFNEQLQDSLDSYLASLNADGRYRYVLSYTRGGTILYSDPALDITREVIEGMNRRLKK